MPRVQEHLTELSFLHFSGRGNWFSEGHLSVWTSCCKMHQAALPIYRDTYDFRAFPGINHKTMWNVSFLISSIHQLTYYIYRFTHFFVVFCRIFLLGIFPQIYAWSCRERSLCAFVKILAKSLFFLAGSLFSFPCLSQNLSNTPDSSMGKKTVFCKICCKF